MKKGKASPWTKVRSKIVYENFWLRVRHDNVIQPDGKASTYGVVEKADYPIIVPFCNGKYYLVHQYRYPVESNSWEFPQGHRDAGESLIQAAVRELHEETGLTAKPSTVRRIGFFWLAPGHNTQGCQVFFADHCRIGQQKGEASEADLRARGFSKLQIDRMIARGQIKDGPTIAAWYLVRQFKRKNRTKTL